MSEWQDIETAPKGDASILLWDGREVVHGCWVPEPIRGGYWFALYDHGFGWDGTPTHWQPLPNPPKPDEAQS